MKTAFYENNESASIKLAKTNGPVNKNSQSFLNVLLKKYGANKLAEVQQRVEEVKNVMRDNVDKTLENVEKLEDLEQKIGNYRKLSASVREGCDWIKVIDAMPIH